VKGVNAAGTTNGNDQTFFTVCNVAGPAGTITGPGQVCNGGTGYVYTVPAIANANGYNWTVPFGAVITAGANTNTITVSYTNPSYSGNIFVYGVGCAGNGASSNIVVIVQLKPCTDPYRTLKCMCRCWGNVYTTEPGKTNYVWTCSAGGTFTAGGTNTSSSST